MKAFLTEWSQDQTWQHVKPDAPAGISQDLDTTRERIARMSMKDFARAGLVLTVDSAALGERVIFVSDNTPTSEQMNGLIEYRAAELNQLLGLTIDQLRKIHALKKTFHVSIESIRMRE